MRGTLKNNKVEGNMFKVGEGGGKLVNNEKKRPIQFSSVHRASIAAEVVNRFVESKLEKHMVYKATLHSPRDSCRIGAPLTCIALEQDILFMLSSLFFV